MNSVSWFLYFTDVVGNLGILLTGVTVTSICGAVVAAFIFGFCIIEEEDTKTPLKALKWSVAILAISSLSNVLLPSKNTLYAIAASQVGEQVIKNEAVQGIANDATKALQQWIKKQLTEEKK